MERLQKVMAQAGIASRRKSEEWIQKGKVRVNGQVVTELGVKVDPARDVIEVEGRRVHLEKQRVFLFYKPKRVITSLSDPQGRKTITDYIRDIPERVYPVGRLDYDTEGLLILTNDGELAHRLAHPRYEVDKCYKATVEGHPGEDKLERLRKGVPLEDGRTAPAKVRLLEQKKNTSVLELIIHEGRNRQVRRMCEAVGHPVRHLIRTRVAFLGLGALRPGAYRELTESEVARLKQLLRFPSFK
jgi:23S rRNA pseudouridine2605 synthase